MAHFLQWVEAGLACRKHHVRCVRYPYFGIHEVVKVALAPAPHVRFVYGFVNGIQALLQRIVVVAHRMKPLHDIRSRDAKDHLHGTFGKIKHGDVPLGACFPGVIYNIC